MKSVAVADLKKHFSDVLEELKQDGKDMKKPVKLGVLEGVATYKFRDDFKMTEEEFLNS